MTQNWFMALHTGQTPTWVSIKRIRLWKTTSYLQQGLSTGERSMGWNTCWDVKSHSTFLQDHLSHELGLWDCYWCLQSWNVCSLFAPLFLPTVPIPPYEEQFFHELGTSPHHTQCPFLRYHCCVIHGQSNKIKGKHPKECAFLLWGVYFSGVHQKLC